MNIIIIPILNCVALVLGLYQYAVIAYIILGWLEFFKVVNPYSNIVYSIHNFLFALVEPVLNHIRRLIPFRSGIDISAIILMIGIYFTQNVIAQLIFKLI